MSHNRVEAPPASGAAGTAVGAPCQARAADGVGLPPPEAAGVPAKVMAGGGGSAGAGAGAGAGNDGGAGGAGSAGGGAGAAPAAGAGAGRGAPFKAKKDPARPKRALSRYQCHNRLARAAVAAAHPGARQQELMTLLAARWRALSAPERAAFADGTPPAADAHAQKAAAAAAEKAGPAAPRASRLPYIESWDVALSDSNLDIGQDGSSARRPNSDGCYPAGLATPPALKFTLSAEVR